MFFHVVAVTTAQQSRLSRARSGGARHLWGSRRTLRARPPRGVPLPAAAPGLLTCSRGAAAASHPLVPPHAPLPAPRTATAGPRPGGGASPAPLPWQPRRLSREFGAERGCPKMAAPSRLLAVAGWGC